MNYRSHHCGELNLKDNGKSVFLQGWVQKRRDHGGVVFVDLRDRYGITQVVFNPQTAPKAHEWAIQLRSEFVIGVKGIVHVRPEGMVNENLSTGSIEILASELEIYSKAQTPPFAIENNTDVSEDLRLKYRYLDLRRPVLQQYFFKRHHIFKSLREFLDSRGFTEVETPILTKATPEGARDYLVPSRVHPGEFYALPQSPQLFKQLLMIAGFDRYYQIARCFRDEDLRADRQPEFTQLDIEISFATQELLYSEMEKMIQKLWKDVLNEDIEIPFPHLPYDEAQSLYASDKPDLRWPFELKKLNSIFKNTSFNVFLNVLKQNGEIRGFCLPGGSSFSRSQIDLLTEKAKSYGTKGLVWIKREKDVVSCSIEKFLSTQEIADLVSALNLKNGDIGFLIADESTVARSALVFLKKYCVEKLEIKPLKKYAFVWIDEFPMFEFDEQEKRFAPVHHPFTSPRPEDLPDLMEGKNLGALKARAYDLVLNGYEIGGGSIRIHDTNVQAKIFEILKLSQEEARQKFGFFLDALTFGTPPHGGIAFGMDRIAMLMSGTEAIRDVIAFPKTQSAIDLMAEAPSEVPVKSLQELHIVSLKPKK